MREILFRGKRVDNGEWETGSLVILRKGCSDEQVFIADKMTGHHTPVVASTVGQYIPQENFYEGDVLFGKEADEYGSTLSTWCGVVKYDESTGRIRVQDDTGDWYETDDFLYDQIIGNIHDNPGLR